MSLKSKFKSNSALINDGVWFDVVTNSDGTKCRVKLRRHGRGNRHWLQAYRDRTANVDTDNLSPEEDELLTADVFMDAIVVEWENFQPEDDGVNLTDRDEMRVLLKDPDWVDLLKDWQAKSNTLKEFQDKRETEGKN